MQKENIIKLLHLANLSNIQANAINGFKVEDFYKNLNNIPTTNGIYFVVFDKNTPIKICKNCEIHKTKNIATKADLSKYLKENLQSKLELYQENSNILYIGKAEAKKGGLRTRLKQYIDTYKNKHGVHNGGKAVWQVNDPDSLIIFYIVEEFLSNKQSSSIETALLEIFKDTYGTYPLANWKK